MNGTFTDATGKVRFKTVHVLSWGKAGEWNAYRALFSDGWGGTWIGFGASKDAAVSDVLKQVHLTADQVSISGGDTPREVQTVVCFDPNLAGVVS